MRTKKARLLAARTLAPQVMMTSAQLNTVASFLNLQQGIDGITVLVLLPPVADVSQFNIGRDSAYWSWVAKK